MPLVLSESRVNQEQGHACPARQDTRQPVHVCPTDFKKQIAAGPVAAWTMGGVFKKQCQHPESLPALPVPLSRVPLRDIKAILLGDSGCGAKSSLLRRLCDREFSNVFITTIGIDYKRLTIRVPYSVHHKELVYAFLMSQHPKSLALARRVVPQLPTGVLQMISDLCVTRTAVWDATVTIWDTAGQERFQCITDSYLKASLDILAFGYPSRPPYSM